MFDLGLCLLERAAKNKRAFIAEDPFIQKSQLSITVLKDSTYFLIVAGEQGQQPDINQIKQLILSEKIPSPQSSQKLWHPQR